MEALLTDVQETGTPDVIQSVETLSLPRTCGELQKALSTLTDSPFLDQRNAIEFTPEGDRALDEIRRNEQPLTTEAYQGHPNDLVSEEAHYHFRKYAAHSRTAYFLK